MSEPVFNSETKAELVTLLEQLKTHGQNWKAALEQQGCFTLRFNFRS